MKIYLDSCASSRPLDLQLNEEIRKEAKAVEKIIREVSKDYLKLVNSDVLWEEIEAIKDRDKRLLMEGILIKADIYVVITPDREKSEKFSKTRNWLLRCFTHSLC